MAVVLLSSSVYVGLVIVIGAVLVLYELWIRSLSPAVVTGEPPAP